MRGINMTQKRKPRKQIRISKALLNDYMKHQDHDGFTHVITEMCKRITDGDYDHITYQQDKKKQVNVNSEYVNKAQQKAKKLGYNQLSDMIDDIIREELAQVK